MASYLVPFLSYGSLFFKFRFNAVTFNQKFQVEVVAPNNVIGTYS